MLWITGLRATAVNARSFSPEGIDLHDAANVVFDNGAIGSIFGGAAVPEGRRARLRLSIAGSKGIIDMDVDLDRCTIELYDGTTETIALAAGEWAYHCIGPVDALIELAKGAGRNLSPGEVGARTTELIEAMLRSARQGGGVVTGLAAGGETFPVA